jgi:hypothetical protein
MTITTEAHSLKTKKKHKTIFPITKEVLTSMALMRDTRLASDAIGTSLSNFKRPPAHIRRGSSTGGALWQGACAGGAQALASGAAGLVEGAWADLVLLDPAHPAFAARSSDRVLDSLVFAARDGAIREVWARGRRVVTDGVHPARAEAEARVGSVLARVLSA